MCVPMYIYKDIYTDTDIYGQDTCVCVGKRVVKADVCRKLLWVPFWFMFHATHAIFISVPLWPGPKPKPKPFRQTFVSKNLAASLWHFPRRPVIVSTRLYPRSFSYWSVWPWPVALHFSFSFGFGFGHVFHIRLTAVARRLSPWARLNLSTYNL